MSRCRSSRSPSEAKVGRSKPLTIRFRKGHMDHPIRLAAATAAVLALGTPAALAAQRTPASSDEGKPAFDAREQSSAIAKAPAGTRGARQDLARRLGTERVVEIDRA